jgi:agmatine deiminase
VGVHEEQEEADLLPHFEIDAMAETPTALGYRMPAEWEPHQGTWLSWPKDPNTFPSGILQAVEATYVKMVESLARGEEVRILVDDAKMENRVAKLLGRAERVTFVRIRTVDVWTRDYCPIYLKGPGLAVVKWIFNAWGEKYDDLRPDDEAGERVAEWTGLRVFRPGLVLEGGSVDVNGEGSLITTEQCLLNPNRNPTKSKGELERAMRDYFGVKTVIWLKDGIEGDDTDGHVDDVARFVGARKVVAAVEPAVSDSNHGALEHNLRLLGEARLEGGREPEVVKVPMPPKVASEYGRLPASHLNFYIGNESVLVPTFGGESDPVALKTIGKAFPGRETVGIDCRALVYGLGTLHCVTQQIPYL